LRIEQQPHPVCKMRTGWHRGGCHLVLILRIGCGCCPVLKIQNYHRMGSVIIPSDLKIVNRMRKAYKRMGWRKFLLHWHT